MINTKNKSDISDPMSPQADHTDSMSNESTERPPYHEVETDDIEDDYDAETNPSENSDGSYDSKQDTDTISGDVYSNKTIYKTTDVSRKLDNTSADMVRYYARQYKDFLPDAICVESGSPRFSQRDIDILERILLLKKEYGYSKEQIMAALSDSSNRVLTSPSILTHENFMNLLHTDGFTDFMDYYTDSMIKKLKLQDDKKLDAFLERITLLLNDVSHPSISSEKESEAALLEAQNEIEMKEEEIKKLQESQETLEKKLEEFQQQLDEVKQNKPKGLFSRLFNK